MLYIRTDMNQVIATGHLMRCLSIADAARMFGHDATFIVADSLAVKTIEARGYPAIILNTRWDCMEEELDALQFVISQYGIKGLLIDSYQVTEHYLQKLSKKVKLAYIDDLNSFIYPVHTLICYANYWKKFSYEAYERQTELLLGTSYIPVRNCFKNCKKKFINPTIEHVLLLSGGTDPYHMLESILKEAAKKEYKRITVICGTYYTDYESFRLQYKMYPNIYFYRGVSNIEDYMFQADMAVSAGGTTLYELCACGTPAISYSFADNQLDNVMQFQKDQVIDYAGDCRYTDIVKSIIKYLNQYHSQPQLRRERSERMQRLVDGNGAERIAKELIDRISS